MSKSEVERFAADIRTNATLQQAVKEKVTDTASLIAVGRSLGYDFTIDDVRAHLRAMKYDLTDQELDAVVGGVAGLGGMSGMIGITGFAKP